MDSKGWKLLILAPIALTFLTACPERKHHDDTYAYAGHWMSEAAWADYNETRGNIGMFCQAVQANAHRHGMYEKGRIRVDALWINGAGEVYTWGISVREYTEKSAGCYRLGQLGGNGAFVQPRVYTGPEAYKNRRIANPYDRMTVDQSGRMAMWGYSQSRHGTAARYYIRVSEYDLRTYQSQLDRCDFGMPVTYDDPGASCRTYGYAEGPQPYTSFAPGTQPPPYPNQPFTDAPDEFDPSVAPQWQPPHRQEPLPPK